MTNKHTRSNSTTPLSAKAKLRRDKFALLARVGHQKRKASAYLEETEFYYGIVTELLALSGDLLDLLGVIEKHAPAVTPLLAVLTSRQHHLARLLLDYWPQNSESQSRILDLLDADGLANLLETTEDGYLTLSSDQILANVERIIAPTNKESSQSH